MKRYERGAWLFAWKTYLVVTAYVLDVAYCIFCVLHQDVRGWLITTVIAITLPWLLFPRGVPSVKEIAEELEEQRRS